MLNTKYNPVLYIGPDKSVIYSGFVFFSTNILELTIIVETISNRLGNYEYLTIIIKKPIAY